MKKITLIFAVLIFSAITLSACGGTNIDGEYKKYIIQTDFATNYYLMTLKSGKFTFEEITTLQEEKTTKSIVSGSYSYDEESGEVTFKPKVGQDFTGTYTAGTLSFTYQYENYVLK